MRLALELAGTGAGHVSPNPMVGAVIVKNGKADRRRMASVLRRPSRGAECAGRLQRAGE